MQPSVNEQKTPRHILSGDPSKEKTKHEAVDHEITAVDHQERQKMHKAMGLYSEQLLRRKMKRQSIVTITSEEKFFSKGIDSSRVKKNLEVELTCS